MRLGFVIATMMTFAVTPVHAETSRYFSFLLGVDLQSLCATDANGCKIYVEGVFDGIQAVRGPTDFACPPDTASSADLVDAVTSYLDAHPRDLAANSAAVLTVMALQERFPCP